MSEYIKPLIDYLKKSLAALDQSYHLSTMRKVTVMEGRGYRKAPILATQEFLLSGVRAAKREKEPLIFEFTPIDGSGDYEHMELNLSEARDFLSGFEEALLEVMGLSPWATVDGSIGGVINWLNKEGKRLAAERAAEEELQAAQQAAAALNRDAANPDWGQF